jgi:hypothetical protein
MTVLTLNPECSVVSAQAELFPYRSPESVLAYLRQAIGRVLDVGPELTVRDCAALLGELALLALQMDKIRARIHASPDYQARQALPVVLPLPQRQGGVLRA